MSMTLDRWIALVFLAICLVYGYTAWFEMDALIPPIMQRNPIWPSSFPKVLAAFGAVLSLLVLLGVEKNIGEEKKPDIDWRRLLDYNWVQALFLLLMMVAYALLLRPLGFLASTFLFLAGSSVLLGERRFLLVAIVAGLASAIVWWLVQGVLGIFLAPLPTFL